MVRVLHITGSLNINGTETFIMNVLRNIDRTKLMFDFLLYKKVTDGYEEEARELGSIIRYYSPRRKGYRKYKQSLESFFEKYAKDYQAVHYSGNTFSEILPIKIARKYGIPIRIAHCHGISTTGLHNKLFHLLNRRLISSVATHCFACSEAARNYGFRGTKAMKQAIIIKNGIELEKFKFNPATRDSKRKELNLENNLIIGNVGGFREAKNHEFMIAIMKEILKERPDARLILVGDGPLKDHIKNMAVKAGIEDKIMFLGLRTDIEELLQAFDIFLFPSKYEGLGIAPIEAQAASLPVVASSIIPQETAVSPLIQYLPLDLPASKWAHSILNAATFDRSDKVFEKLKAFDIIETCKKLTEIYLGQ